MQIKSELDQLMLRSQVTRSAVLRVDYDGILMQLMQNHSTDKAVYHFFRRGHYQMEVSVGCLIEQETTLLRDRWQLLQNELQYLLSPCNVKVCDSINCDSFSPAYIRETVVLVVKVYLIDLLVVSREDELHIMYLWRLAKYLDAVRSTLLRPV
jgi:hypothetical protein